MRILGLLPRDARSLVAKELMAFAEGYLHLPQQSQNQKEGKDGEEGESSSSQAVVFHLAAALLQQADCNLPDYNWKPWLEEAQNILRASDEDGGLHSAAVELLAAGSSSEDVAGLLQMPWQSLQDSQSLVPLSEAGAGPAWTDDRVLHLTCASPCLGLVRV